MKGIKKSNRKGLGGYKFVFWYYLKPYRVWLFLGVISCFINIFLNIASIYAIENVVDKIKYLNIDDFCKFIYVIVLIAAGQVFFTFTQKYASSRFANFSICDLRNDLTYHIMKLPLSIIRKYDKGDIVSRLNNDISPVADLISMIPEYFCQPFLFVSALIYMINISLKLTVACTLLIPISSFFFDKINKPVEEASKKKMEYFAKSNSAFQDIINAIYIVKSFNLKEVLSRKYENIAKDIEKQGLYISKVKAFLTPIFLALRFIPQLICPVYGGYLVVKGEMTSGGLIAFLTLIWYVFGPVESILGLIDKLRQVKPALERITEIQNSNIELADGEKFELKNTDIAVEFINVSFSYDCKTKVLKNISFKALEGKVLAIIGLSGGGKSTILNLLCGFYDNYEGDIKVFGNNLKSTNIFDWRSQISLVSQDSYIFPETVFENICCGREEASMEEVIKAAKAAYIHDFIMDLKDGYDTVLSENGKNLSGGQCQRIALARAILKNSPIILFDEPTSALDAQSEAFVIKALKEYILGHTVIIIAHRLDTIKDADEIIVLNEGDVCEKGTHDELMCINSLYKNLYSKQMVYKGNKLAIAANREG